MIRIAILNATDTDGFRFKVRGFALSTELAAHSERYPKMWYGEDLQWAPPVTPRSYLIHKNRT